MFRRRKKTSVLFLLGAKFTADKSVSMLLTGQMHLGAKRSFARPMKHACVPLVVPLTSSVTLFITNVAIPSLTPTPSYEACSIYRVFQQF